MKSFLTQKSVSVDVSLGLFWAVECRLRWCRVQKFCRLRLVLDKISLKESAARPDICLDHI